MSLCILGAIVIIAAILMALVCGSYIGKGERANAYGSGLSVVALATFGILIFGESIRETTIGTPCSLDTFSVGQVVEPVSECIQQEEKDFLCFAKVDGKGPWATKLEQKPAKKSIVATKDDKKVLLPLAEEQPATPKQK